MNKYKITMFAEAEDRMAVNDVVMMSGILHKFEDIIIDLVEEPAEEAPREWMDAEEAKKKAKGTEDYWGWSTGDIVRLWYRNHDGYWCTTPLTDTAMKYSWNLAHQPTHIMQYIEGEEPPAPPELTIEERIAALEKRMAKLESA